jgi:antitoxin (DNA-binding transcriptional repressor) of toxin-antitoxin stability system
MGKTITATEAVRTFSDLLNTIRFKGSRYTIIRGGKPVAVLGPAASSSHEKTLGELKELLSKIPRLGEEVAAFEKDIREARTKQPALPKGRPWA